MILVPYHQDQRQPDDSFPAAADTVLAAAFGPGGDLWSRLAGLYAPVAAAVEERVRAEGTVTVVSGDCLTAVPVVTGVQRAGVDPAVVWFDAHGDVHTLATSTSGYPGGLSLRLVQGGDRALLADPLGLRPVAEDRTVLVGARDLDPAEAAFLADSPVRRSAVTELAADTLPAGPLVLHVDADVVDAGELPGLRFPVPGGPSTADVLAAVGRVLGTGRVAAVSLALPWHPPRSADERRLRAELVAGLSG